MADEYIPEAAPILAGMLDEVTQRLHEQEGRLGIPHRTARWTDCSQTYCLAVRMKGMSLLVDAPIQVLEPGGTLRVLDAASADTDRDDPGAAHCAHRRLIWQISPDRPQQRVCAECGEVFNVRD